MTNQPVSPKVKRRSRRKNGTKRVEARKGGENIFTNHISSPFCPECQGTGVNIDGDELEKPTISLSQVCML